MRIVFLIIALISSVLADAQNLVPNPSFENYVNCPAGTYELPYSENYTGFLTVNGWCNAVKFTSPDYYNVCTGPNTVASIPKNPWGYQQPRTGNAYVGIITHREVPGIQDFSEYIYCKLTAPLQAGKLYHVSFYISATAGTQYNGFIDRIGVKFSDTVIYERVIHRLYGSYDLRTPQGILLNDTVNWVQVSGKYKAKGGERFMTIGNFYDSSILKQQYAGGTPSNNFGFYAYYFIDDVSVVDSGLCDTAYSIRDTFLCNNDSITLRSSIEGGKKFSWSTGATDTTITVGQAGEYWCVTLKDSCDYYVDTFRIGLYADTQKVVTDTAVCLFDTNIYIRSSIDKGDEYTWSTGENTQEILIADTGIYYCYITKACTVYQEEVRVQHVSIDTVRHSIDTSLCLYTGIGIDITSTLSNADIYRWNDNSTLQALHIKDTGSYYCIARKGCNVLYDVFNVSHPSFDYSIELGNDTLLCSGVELNIGQDLQNEMQYQWNTGSNNCCIVLIYDGKYKLTITDGCTRVSDSIIIAFEKCEHCIVLPTAFSPNQDGRNDIFRAHTRCGLVVYDFKVFNRWGEVVFQTDNLLQGWDGKYKGRLAEMGAYYYIVKYKQKGDDKIQIKKGDVMLVR